MLYVVNALVFYNVIILFSFVNIIQSLPYNVMSSSTHTQQINTHHTKYSLPHNIHSAISQYIYLIKSPRVHRFLKLSITTIPITSRCHKWIYLAMYVPDRSFLSNYQLIKSRDTRDYLLIIII